jgi:hypothetical protein
VTSQYLKDISNNMGSCPGFHISQGAVDTPPQRDASHYLVAAASGLGESTLSMGDSELKIKSQLAMLGKGAGPSKHIYAWDQARQVNIPLVVVTSQREAVWVRLGLVSDTKQVLTPDSYSGSPRGSRWKKRELFE